MGKKSAAEKRRSKQGGGDGTDTIRKIKKSKQSTIFGAVQLTSRELLMVGREVLLTDAIYSGRVPEGMRGMLFCYFITSYDVEAKVFALRYTNKMIGAEGVQWVHQDGDRENMNNVNVDTVKDGIKLHNAAITRINNYDQAQVNTAKEVLKQKVSSHEDVIDMSDLDEAAKQGEKGWMGQQVIEVDFELTGKTG